VTETEPRPGLSRLAAICGATAWTIYGITECWFTSIVPWIEKPSYVYTPVHRGFTALTFLAYPLIGAAATALLTLPFRGAVARHREPGAALRALATASIVALFVANLLHIIFLAPFVFESSVLHLVPLVAVSLVPALAALVGVMRPSLEPALRFLTNPWIVGLALTALPWVTIHLLSRDTTMVKMAAAAAVPTVIFALSWLLHRGRGSRPVRPGRAAAVAGAVAVATFAATFFTTHTPKIAGDPPQPPTGTRRPNVLLIVMDTVRANHLSLYGYERRTTPRLEEFARVATLHTRMTSAADITLTTHASIFTGLYGRQHGAHRSDATPAGRPLASSFVTLAETLLAESYWTVAVVANRGYVSPHFGFDQGFLHFDSRGPVPFLAKTPPFYLRRGVRAALLPFAPRDTFDRLTRSADSINEDAFRLLEQARDRGGPFFLFVNYMDAHHPFLPPPPYDTMFPGKDESWTSVDYDRLLWAVMRHGHRAISERERNHITSQYDGAIAYEESRIHALLEHLRELSLYDDTLVIVTADHGEALGDRDLLNHGVSVYQDQVSVPLIVKYPGQKAGAVVDAWTNSVDLLPTVLDVLGLPDRPGLPGESLRRIARDADRLVVAESFPGGSESNFDRTEWGLFRGPYKLIRSTAGKHELYDLERDSEESTSLYAETDTTTKRLEAELDAWLAATEARGDSSTFEYDADVEERLRALGYIE
jgi:arylsulfatase A-like enzyme